MRPFLFFGPLLMVCAGVAAAQQGGGQETEAPTAVAAGAPTLSMQARLVTVPVVVRDKHGALVGGLTRENFALQVDGVAQPIRYFDHDADLPLTVGLLVDTSMSQRTVLDDERTASVTFIQKMLAPERDKAFVIQFAGTVDLLADITASRPKLQSALQELDTTPQRPPDDAGGDPHPHHHGGGTALYDAVFLSADEVMPKQQGRRAFILLTDGVDNGSKETLAKAIEAAQRANTVVYAIYYKGEEHGGGGWGGDHHGWGGPGGGGPGGGGPGGHYFQYPGHQEVDGKKILQRLCAETGGRVFEVSKKETVEKIYAEIGEELRSQFRLGFSPSASAGADGYHKISVALAGVKDGKKDKVQARDGYYTGKP